MEPGPPLTITCVDCGGVCHRLGDDPELGWHLGDLVVTEEDLDDEDGAPS